jgi:UDP-N-acetylmuramoylalanine-D-glutamate ligase
MADDGEWNRKGAVLSDVTAQKDYGVSRDFIVKGVQAGQLEYREGSSWGNPWFRLLRSQIERYIVTQFGPEHLARVKTETELRAVRKEIAGMRKKLAVLEARKAKLEHAVRA